MAEYTNKIPKMFDTAALVAAGIDPKTGLPLAMRGCRGDNIPVEDIRKQLRIVDEQDAVNRYTWTGLPYGLTGQLIERILYYRGSGAMFLLGDKFYFLPYTLCPPEGSTGLDVYGRFTGITPLPFNGSVETKEGKETPLIQGLIYEPLYDIPKIIGSEAPSKEELISIMEKSCVLLHDYTPQISQTILPRQRLNDPLLGAMAQCIPFMQTALSNSTGVMGMRVGSEDEAASVYAASGSINKAAVEGRKFVPIIANTELQELTSGNTLRAEEFLLCMQALDNYRLSLYGLDNSGLFQKRSHLLQEEQRLNSQKSSLMMEDGLYNRQYFCTLANSAWGFTMWCEENDLSNKLAYEDNLPMRAAREVIETTEEVDIQEEE